MSSNAHVPVLLGPVLEGLKIKPDGCYVDGTFGRGGHSGKILQQLGANGRLIAIDRDPQAIAAAPLALTNDPRFELVRDEIAQLETIITARGLLGKIDGLLLDLGVSSPQLDEAGRGFSFMRDGPLDMRMDPDTGIPASQWLADVAESDLKRVLRQYGEEPSAGRIARAIVEARTAADIQLLGNPDLDPKVTVEYETGLQHEFGGLWSMGITFFNRDIYDYAKSVSLGSVDMRLSAPEGPHVPVRGVGIENVRIDALDGDDQIDVQTDVDIAGALAVFGDGPGSGSDVLNVYGTVADDPATVDLLFQLLQVGAEPLASKAERNAAVAAARALGAVGSPRARKHLEKARTRSNPTTDKAIDESLATFGHHCKSGP